MASKLSTSRELTEVTRYLQRGRRNNNGRSTNSPGRTGSSKEYGMKQKLPLCY